MKRIVETFLLIILFGVVLPVVFSQSTATEAVERERQAQRERESERQTALDIKQRMAKLRELEASPRPRINPPKISAEDREISKEAEKWIREMRKVSVDDLRLYSNFLKDKNAGIFRIFPNFDCVSKNVVRADGPCEAFVPETSDYSFGKRDYTSELFHEIELNNGYLISDGFFSQGLMVSFGNIPIDEITSDYAGLTFLNNFRPAETPSDARIVAYRLKQGIPSNGFIYSDRLVANEDTTYALRVVAYRGDNAARNLKGAVNLHGWNAAFGGFTSIQRSFYMASIDDRKDNTVVFRVVRSSADGGLTIIWKGIRKTKGPDLKFLKGEVPSDFKPR